MSTVREYEYKLFKDWEAKYRTTAGSSNLFCYDGLHYLGKPFKPDGKHWEMKKNSTRAESLWEQSKMRCMFLTKEHNASEDGEGFDSRIETGIDNQTGKMYHRFYARWIKLLYGLCSIDISTFSFPGYSALPSSEKLLKEFQFNLPCVRINLKKIAGKSTCSTGELRGSIERDYDYIKRQILFYDANVFVCCAGAGKEYNPIMQILFNLYPDLQLFSVGAEYDFIYFSPSSHIIVLHEWHPSVPTISHEDYYSAVPQVSNFLKSHPKFLKDFSGYRR